MAKVSVLGAGSWGTALSLLLCKNGHEVTLWSALEDEVRMLCEKREHESKLPGVRLPEDMKITADLEDSLQDPDVAVLAVPSPFTSSQNGAFCKKRTDHCERGQRCGRTYSDDFKRDHQ